MKVKKPSASVLSFVGLAIFALALGFFSAYGGRLSSRLTTPTSVDATKRLPQAPGDQIVLVVAVSGSCPACGNPALPAKIRQIKEAVGEYAASRGASLVSIGVAVDQQPKQGLMALERFGEFTQLSIGASWANQALLPFLDLGLPSVSEIPQVIVFRRQIEDEGRALIVRDRTLLARRVGLEAIASWVEAGVSLPRLTTARK